MVFAESLDSTMHSSENQDKLNRPSGASYQIGLVAALA